MDQSKASGILGDSMFGRDGVPGLAHITDEHREQQSLQLEIADAHNSAARLQEQAARLQDQKQFMDNSFDALYDSAFDVQDKQYQP